MGEFIHIPTHNGSFAAYLAQPSNSEGRFPVIVVIQEIFGVNVDIRETCDELAAQGYGALCPDLFWRMEPRVELSSSNEAEWRQALALYQAFDIDQGVEDISTTLSLARQLPGASGKVGLIGFCMGGLMTFLTAVRKGADAAVAYYGGGTERYVGEDLKLYTPLMMHLAEQDEFMGKLAQTSIRNKLVSHPLVKICNYPGCQHAFARHGGAHFDPVAARLARARTAKFLRFHLM